MNPLKCEYFLPLIPNQLLHEHKATVQALRRVRDEGIYPGKLW